MLVRERSEWERTLAERMSSAGGPARKRPPTKAGSDSEGGLARLKAIPTQGEGSQNAAQKQPLSPQFACL